MEKLTPPTLGRRHGRGGSSSNRELLIETVLHARWGAAGLRPPSADRRPPPKQSIAWGLVTPGQAVAVPRIGFPPSVVGRGPWAIGLPSLSLARGGRAPAHQI